MIICGDETGLLKAVDPLKKSSRLVSTSLSQNRRRGVAALASDELSSSSFRCARKDGHLETWECKSPDLAFEDDAWSMVASCEGLVGDCVGLSCSSGRVVSCADDGRVQVSSGRDGSVSGDGGLLDVEGSVSAFDCLGNLVAVGGREHELSVWNLDNFEREWRARNVPNDKLDLRRPVWVASAKFVDENVLVIATKYKQIRLYDTRAQRRPVRDVEDATQNAARRVALLGCDKILVGDIAGMLQTFHLKTMTIENRFVGPAGSIREIVKHPRLDSQFAAVGLDRHCHVWDATRPDKRNAFASVYCKQRLTAALWLPSPLTADQEDDEDDDFSSNFSE